MSKPHSHQIINYLNIKQGIFSEDELKLFQKGGVTLSDSDSEDIKGEIDLKFLSSKTKIKHSPYQHGQDQGNCIKSQSIISKLQQKNDYLENELKRIKVTYEAEKQKINMNNRMEMHQLMLEIKQQKSQHTNKKPLIYEIKNALSQVRNIITGLTSDSGYLQIRDLNEDDLSLEEWILIQVYEIAYPLNQEIVLQRKEILSLREELQKRNDRWKNQSLDNEQNQRILKDREDDMRRYKLNYENENKALKLELEKNKEEFEILRGKGARFDELNRNYKIIQQEKQLLEEKIKQGVLGQQNGQKEVKMQSEMLKMQDEFSRLQDMLKLDKEYLSKENTELIEKNRRLEDKIEKLQTECVEAKNVAQDYLHKLLNTRNESNSQYETKIYTELQTLKEKQQHEIEVTKNNLVDIYEKQLQFIKEAKEEQEIKKESLEGSLREKSNSYDQLMADFRNLQRRTDQDISELKIQYRIKVDQLERVENLYEETLGNCKYLKQENEMLKEKINVLKSEYYKLQVDCKEDMTGLKAQYEVTKQQLQNYEGIEKEIDEAIIQNPNEKQGSPLSFFESVPTSNKRRIQQALNLAQRLQQKQIQCEQLQKQLSLRDNDIQRLKEEVEIQQDVIDKMNQPHSYLVHHLEEQDREIVKYKKTLKQIQQEYSILQEDLKDIKTRYRQAEEDIEKLKLKRQNISQIQNILLGMAQSESHQDMKNHLKLTINEITNTLGYNQSMNSKKYGEQTPPSRDQSAPNWYQRLKSKKK